MPTPLVPGAHVHVGSRCEHPIKANKGGVELGPSHELNGKPSGGMPGTTLAIELDDEEVRVVRRTTTQPVRSIKTSRAQRGR